MTENPVNDLHGLATQLDSARKTIEDKFLAAGTVLSNTIENTGALIASLDRHAAALDASTVASVTDEFKHGAQLLLELPAAQAGRHARMMRLSEHCERLSIQSSKISKSFDYMAVLGLNMRITASVMSAEDSDVIDFARSIEGTIGEGRHRLTVLQDDISNLHRELDTTLKQGNALKDRNRDRLPAAVAEVIAAAEVIEAQQSRISGVAVAAADISRQLTQKVALILGALQIGDITRQRVEHVVSGLHFAMQASQGLTEQERNAFGRFVYTVLGAQLAAASAEFKEQVGMIRSGMTGLAADTSELLRLRMTADNGGTGRGFSSDFSARVGRVLSLVDEIAGTERTSLAASRLAANAGKKLAVLVGAIQEMRTNIHFLALNAILRCNRVGELGRPLAVIAAEVRDQGRLLGEAGAEILSVLGELDVSVEQLIASCDPGNGGADFATSALRDAAAVVEGASRRGDDEIATVTQRIGLIVDTLGRSMDGLGIEDDIGMILECAARACSSLSGAAEQPVGAMADALQEYFDQLASLYTMAQERMVHQQWAQAWGLSFPLQSTPVDELDDVLF